MNIIEDVVSLAGRHLSACWLLAIPHPEVDAWRHRYFNDTVKSDIRRQPATSVTVTGIRSHQRGSCEMPRYWQMQESYQQSRLCVPITAVLAAATGVRADAKSSRSSKAVLTHVTYITEG